MPDLSPEDQQLKDEWEKNPQVRKRLTSVQRAAEGTGSTGGLMRPTDEQLAKINSFTRTPKSADEVVALPVMACNDIVDRDVDRFPPECVSGFMELEGPLSPIGKSFMVGHDYRGLPIGRVFDGEVVKEEGVTWLKLMTYVPNTEQYAAYLENVDYGVFWAVSVGVMLGAATCSVGDSHDWGWHPYVCGLGHEKGQRYDPTGEPGDRWDPQKSDPNGVLCWRNLEQPEDFYELSQVYLGAQYMAEFDKKHEGGFVKAASFSMDKEGAVEVMPLKEAEAKDELPPEFPKDSHIAKAVEEGQRVEPMDNGIFRFVEAGLVWTFNPESNEELCLGKLDGIEDVETAPEDKEKTARLAALTATAEKYRKVRTDAEDFSKWTKQVDEAELAETVSSLDVTIDAAETALADGDVDTASGLIVAADALVDDLMEMLGLDDPDEAEESGDEPTLDNLSAEEEMPKAAVLEYLRKNSSPQAVIEQVEAADDDKAAVAAMAGLNAEVAKLREDNDSLTHKAALGDKFVAQERNEVVHWFTMSQRDPQNPEKGVEAAKIDRLNGLLEKCGDDVEMLLTQKALYKELAQARFPEAVRRSSFPDDPNATEGLKQQADGDGKPIDTAPAKRIHG